LGRKKKREDRETREGRKEEKERKKEIHLVGNVTADHMAAVLVSSNTRFAGLSLAQVMNTFFCVFLLYAKLHIQDLLSV
jgi:hypothetical protein